MANIYLKDVKMDQIVYECQYGQNIKMRIVHDPIFVDGVYETMGKTDKGGIIELRQSPGMEHYGPRLYNEPQYFILNDGEVRPNNVDI